MPLSPIHPFPARMAPELARQYLNSVPEGGSVIDPMCGSGTVVRAAVEAGLKCLGTDIDPLAVLMARAWVTPLEPKRIRVDAEKTVQAAKALADSEIAFPTDPSTSRFISYWFARRQRVEVARLATVLRRTEEPVRNALAVALSRIIISKEMMASLARDTSHSRPHKVARSNDFAVYGGFLRSARQVAARLQPDLMRGHAEIRRLDARALESAEDECFDLALTSPPYLNAIDYIRGHRLALVWLGYEMRPLREIRSASVGTERMMPEADTPWEISQFVIERPGSTIGPRHRGWIRRYASDMDAVLRELRRVIKPRGHMVLVLGNSFLRGSVIDNAKLIEMLAERIGFSLQDRHVRHLPARRRYLPPPSSGRSALDTRMRTETVLTFDRANGAQST